MPSKKILDSCVSEPRLFRLSVFNMLRKIVAHAKDQSLENFTLASTRMRFSVGKKPVYEAFRLGISCGILERKREGGNSNDMTKDYEYSLSIKDTDQLHSIFVDLKVTIDNKRRLLDEVLPNRKKKDLPVKEKRSYNKPLSGLTGDEVVSSAKKLAPTSIFSLPRKYKMPPLKETKDVNT